MGASLLALDADTGLVHLGAREYDPETGAFTRRDPSGLEGGENQYAYAGGDPVNYWDPDGNFVAAVVVGAAAGAAIGGAEGAVFGAADEVLDQAFDPGRTGFDCAAIRSAAGRGAAAGAAAGAVAGGIGAAARAPKEHGSYTNTHESGKKYHGKGSRARSQRSGAEKAQKNGDPHVATDWSPSPNERGAFKDEAKRIGPDGVVEKGKNSDTYNEINSPGHRYMKEDGEWP